jgi:hypothetical protein
MGKDIVRKNAVEFENSRAHLRPQESYIVEQGNPCSKLKKRSEQ